LANIALNAQANFCPAPGRAQRPDPRILPGRPRAQL